MQNYNVLWGFPGTKALFSTTIDAGVYDYILASGLSHAYSPRSGCPAESYESRAGPERAKAVLQNKADLDSYRPALRHEYVGCVLSTAPNSCARRQPRSRFGKP